MNPKVLAVSCLLVGVISLCAGIAFQHNWLIIVSIICLLVGWIAVDKVLLTYPT